MLEPEEKFENYSMKNITKSQILNWSFYNASDFEKKIIFFVCSDPEMKFLQLIRLWNENFLMRQILKKNTDLKNHVLTPSNP